MKYKIATIKENGSFVGIVTQNDEIIHKTKPTSNANEASMLVSRFIQKLPTNFKANMNKQPLPGTSRVANNPPSQPKNTSNTLPVTPRKCCGRR